MTEYWVSQGKKWCDFCKIFIANNPLSIRTHDLGQRHKDNVTKRLASMRKESAARDKEQKNAAHAIEQIEDKAKRSYQKDLASFEADKSTSHSSEVHKRGPNNVKFSSRDGWEHDAASGYYYNLSKGFHYDPNSGLFYSSDIGKWVSEEEAFKSPKNGSGEGSTSSNSGKAASAVVSCSRNPTRTIKGAPSSIAVNKRKRENEKPKAVSKEEAEALKAREAAKKRVEEREKPLMGLYRSY